MKDIYCCKDLSFFLHEGKVAINYFPKYREYSINLIEGNAIQLIHYCPWCGKEFPTSLRDEFFDTLESDFGIEVSIGDLQDNNLIPEEFKTDEWWKKRGL